MSALRGLALALAVPLAACGAADESVASSSSAIVGGTASDSSQDGAVLIGVNPTHGFCGGALVAPNLVLTARSCVAELTGSGTGYACDERGMLVAGRGYAGRLYDPSDLLVFTGPRGAAGDDSGPKAAAKGAKLVAGDKAVLCGNDVAFIVLDRKLDGARVLPVRLDREVVADEAFVLAGYGLDDDLRAPAERRQRTLTVGRVGPAPRSGTSPTLSPGTFESGEGPCLGDSGAPAVSTRSGAVIGVMSAVSVVDGSDPCRGKALSFFTSLGGLKDLTLRAFDAAGATPVPEDGVTATGARAATTPSSDVGAGTGRGCSSAPAAPALPAWVAAALLLAIRRPTKRRAGR